MPNWFCRCVLRCSIAWLLGSVAIAQTNLPFLHPLFTSHMVLQRDASDAVWGWTAAGASVSVAVMDQNNAAIQTKTATAGSDGRWQVNVGPFSLVTNNAAYSLVITRANTNTTLTDVLIGDVWLCSGQSNMEYTLYGNYPQGSGGTRMANSPAEVTDAAANYPYIRHFKTSRGTAAATPQETFIGGIDSGGWTTTAANAINFTAVGYFMAREIYNSQHVPIGLLNLTWGGTDIAPWVPGETLRTIADFTATVDAMPTNTSPGGSTPTAIFNAVVAPAADFQIKGAIWYQGESSTGYGQQKYGAVLAALRDGLRLKFHQPNLPFLAVQLCTSGNAQSGVEAVNGNNYAEIRGAELTSVTSDANSRLITTIDLGFVQDSTNYSADVHPINKQDMGKRAGAAALNLVYGQNTQYLPVLFNHATVEGNAMRCYFDNTGNGLMVGLKPQGLNQNAAPSPSPVQMLPAGTLTGFQVAGTNKTYVAATATIDSATNTVVVSSPSVTSPLYVRYGWNSNPWNTTVPSASGSFGTPLCNLYGKVTDGNGTVIDGTAASPFQNDPVYQLSVNSGSGSNNSLAPGAQTTVTASAAPSGQAFAFWNGDTGSLANANAASTTATLSKRYVSIVAIYKLNTATAGLTGTAGSLKAILSWTALTNATSYSVKRSSSANGNYITLATGLLSPAYTDNNTGFGFAWYYKISAINAAGESPDSASFSVTPNAPAAPTVTGTAGNTTANLFWPAIANVTGYEVRRSLNNGGPFDTIVVTNLSGNAYTDTGLTNFTAYSYVVVSLYNGSAGPASTAVSITPTSSTALVRRATGGTASGATNSSNSAEGPASAFDGNISTKWFGVQSTISAASPAYLVYQFASGTAWNVTQYQFATANDSQNRDPKDWLFQSSNDGFAWTTLDTKTNQTLGAARNTYLTAITISNTLAYRYYRLAVTKTFGTDIGTQLSELVLSSSPSDPGDKVPPVITLPANITADATSASGANVNFFTTASDAVSGTVVPVSTPASGSVFPAGSTTVQIRATDAAGNSATTSFTVTVRGLIGASDLQAPILIWNGSTAQISVGSSVAGHTYQLQRSADLASDTWINVGSSQNGGGSLSFSDTPESTDAKMFYRLVVGP